MIAMRQMSGIDDNVKDTVNNHDKEDANDAASSHTVSERNGDFGQKSQNFPISVYLTPR